MNVTHRQKKPYTKVTTIKMKRKHWFSGSLHPPESIETKKSFQQVGQTKIKLSAVMRNCSSTKTQAKISADISARLFRVTYNKVSSILIHKN